MVDVIVKTGEGALEVFQLLLENCQEPENKGDLSISVIAISMAKIIINACVASGGWVPMGQGAATAIHPKAEEHPQAYQPATQPRAPPRPAPHYSTRHTEARSPVEVK